MRVLLLADSLFASRERSLLSRLEIGLADEAVEVFQALPQGLAETMDPQVFARTVSYNPRPTPIFRSIGVRRLVRMLTQVDALDRPQDIDIVHALGGSVWELALDLARELEAGLALEVWRMGLVGKAVELRLNAGDRAAFLAPDPHIDVALRERLKGQIVRLHPWGVLASDQHAIMTPGRDLAFMIVGSGRDAVAYAGVLGALAAVLRTTPDAHIFCDAGAARRANLWPVARALNLLGRLSLIENLEGRRDLVLQGDVLIVPEAHGEQRTVLLEAMAGGVVVVAASDPHVAMLQDGRTACLVNAHKAGSWEQVLRLLVDDPSRAQTLAARARQFVEQERKASDYVVGVLRVYEDLIARRPPTEPSSREASGSRWRSPRG